jgi:hypothetical protein
MFLSEQGKENRSRRKWMLEELNERVNAIEEKIQQIRGYL